MTEAWTEGHIGTLIDDTHYERLFSGEAVDVYRPNGGLLFALRPRTIRSAALTLAFPALLRAARETNHRPIAAAGQERFHSGTIGFLNGGPVSFMVEDRKGMKAIIPLLREMDRVFREDCPQQYQLLREAADRTPPGVLLSDTAFTSATVNKTARMGVHRDKGNLPGAFGAMVVIRDGPYTGGRLVFPQYRVAVDLDNGDCLICDNQQAHGNTPILGEPGAFERVSVVAFFHASNLPNPH